MVLHWLLVSLIRAQHSKKCFHKDPEASRKHKIWLTLRINGKVRIFKDLLKIDFKNS